MMILPASGGDRQKVKGEGRHGIKPEIPPEERPSFGAVQELAVPHDHLFPINAREKFVHVMKLKGKCP